MGNIKTYDAPALDIRPTEVGIHATEAVGRRAGAFFNQAGDTLGGAIRDAGNVAVAYRDHSQISFGAKVGSDMIVEKEKEWDDILKDPTVDVNDPSVAAKFRETSLEPALEKFKQGFDTEKGQQFAEHFVESFRSHMATKTAADMSSRAKVALESNIVGIANNLASAANLDPSSLEFALKQYDAKVGAIIGTSPTLASADAAHAKMVLAQKYKKGIIQSAVAGMLERNPNTDLDAIQKKYGEYITGPEMKQFQQAAKAYQKQDFLFNKQIEKEHLQTQIIQGNNALARVKAENMTFDENDKPIIKPGILKQLSDVAKKYTDRNGDPISQITDHAQTLINTVQQQQRTRHEAVVTNPKVRNELYDGLWRADNPTTDVDIWKASNRDELDDHAARKLLELQKALTEKPFRGPRYQAAMGAVKELTGADLTADGHERYAGFVEAFIPKYIALEREGKLLPNALNTRDPDSLISQTVKEFTLPLSQRMGAMALKRAGLPPMDMGGDPLAPKPKPGLPAGTIRDGYRFKGGDASVKANWEKVK